MHRLVLLAASAAALAASYGTTLAQSVGVELYSGPRYDTYYYDDRYERRTPAFTAIIAMSRCWNLVRSCARRIADNSGIGMAPLASTLASIRQI
jgi:hypothetical protein